MAAPCTSEETPRLFCRVMLNAANVPATNRLKTILAPELYAIDQALATPVLFLARRYGANFLRSIECRHLRGGLPAAIGFSGLLITFLGHRSLLAARRCAGTKLCPVPAREAAERGESQQFRYAGQLAARVFKVS